MQLNSNSPLSLPHSSFLTHSLSALELTLRNIYCGPSSWRAEASRNIFLLAKLRHDRRMIRKLLATLIRQQRVRDSSQSRLTKGHAPPQLEPPTLLFVYILSTVPWKSESVINFKQCGKFTVIFADMPTSVLLPDNRDKTAPEGGTAGEGGGGARGP